VLIELHHGLEERREMIRTHDDRSGCGSSRVAAPTRKTNESLCDGDHFI